MNNIIVGTAGHVDHGKTCLIKALTGVDTDRLKEEKQRGITIDLGFTEIPNDKGIQIGVIDVPGHEKFIKNMLAGVGGMDLVLFVIAADEGVMPQTVEHMEILGSLQIDQGIILLTKVDAVDQDRLTVVKNQVEQFLKGTILENASILEVSSRTGQNIMELKELICSFAERWDKKITHPERLRLPVDRVFTVDGFGTVITGTLIQGALHIGQEIEIYPKGILAKVRNIQVHGVNFDKAQAGQRTAVNLSHVKKEDLKRGDILACKGAFQVTKKLDVRIDMFHHSPRRLLNGSRLHLYHGSGQVLCKVVLLDAEYLDSGQCGYAQLSLEEEIAVQVNDRFVLRFSSPLESMGGGVILDPDPIRRKRFDEKALEGLKLREMGDISHIFEQILMEQPKKILTSCQIASRMGLTREELVQVTESLVRAEKIFELANGNMIYCKTMRLIEEQAIIFLRQYHEENLLKPGMNREEFRQKLTEKIFGMDIKSGEVIIRRMANNKQIMIKNSLVSLPDFGEIVPSSLKKHKDSIEQEYLNHGFGAPDFNEISGMSENAKETRNIIESLCAEGRLEKLDASHYIHLDCLEAAMVHLKGYITKSGRITVAEYRDLLGVSRKQAMRILEYTDGKKITKFKDDVRTLFEGIL